MSYERAVLAGVGCRSNTAITDTLSIAVSPLQYRHNTA